MLKTRRCAKKREECPADDKPAANEANQRAERAHDENHANEKPEAGHIMKRGKKEQK